MVGHESCPTCKKLTLAGEKTWRESIKPIWDVDLSKPLDETIETLRRELSVIRGKLSDIGFAKPALTQDMEMVQGLLTCGLITLNYVIGKIKEREELSKKQSEI